MYCLQTDLVEGGYVKTATRASNGILSSLKCLWAIAGDKKCYGPYERPPFPIKIDSPTWGDVGRELRFSDYFMFGTVYYGMGHTWGYLASRPFPMLMQRLIVYHGSAHLFGVFGLTLMLALPYRRLTGYWDNGLRWKKPEDKLRKYDSTSHFEKATIWKRCRINTDE